MSEQVITFSDEFEKAMVAANHLADEMKVAAGLGLKPGTADQPAIHVFACDLSEAAGFPKKYEGYDVIVEVVGKLDVFKDGHVGEGKSDG